MYRAPRLTLKRTVNPVLEPVSLADAKAHARVDITDDDALIESLIVRARSFCEEQTRRSFITSTWRMSLDRFPCGPLERFQGPAVEARDILLPRPPLIAVTSIAYLDTNGAAQTVASTDYIVSNDDEPARLALAYGKDWPDTLPQLNAVTITYTAGYGATRADVPEQIKHAMLMLVSHWYENREAIGFNMQSNKVDFAVDSLLSTCACQEIW